MYFRELLPESRLIVCILFRFLTVPGTDVRVSGILTEVSPHCHTKCWPYRHSAMPSVIQNHHLVLRYTGCPKFAPAHPTFQFLAEN